MTPLTVVPPFTRCCLCWRVIGNPVRALARDRSQPIAWVDPGGNVECNTCHEEA